MINLNLLSSDGQQIPATLTLEGLSSDSESESRYTLCWETGSCSVESSSDFYALCELRKKLAELNLAPLCYGATENVYPSGMSISMGGGRKAYRLTLGKQARLEDLVDIFDSEPGLVPVSVEEQRAFFDRWVSNRD